MLKEKYMGSFSKSVKGVLGGATRSARAFPVTFVCAIAFAVIALLRIQFEWLHDAPWDFILNCAQWSLALGALFGMAAITAAQIKSGTRGSLIAANLLGLIVVAGTFTAMYFTGTTTTGEIWNANGLWTGGSWLGSSQNNPHINDTAGIRVIAAMFISLVVFIIYAGKNSMEPADSGKTDFTRALFMTHKSFFTALLYGLVALAGASGVAKAVQGLIYSDMSYKVYQYIITLSLLLAFLLFVGYFPDFRKGADTERREKAQHQPRFIEALFSFILIPIMLALTVVLLVWAVMAVTGAAKFSFIQLYSSSAAYTIGGLWLHAMTAKSENGAAKLYRAVYPVAAIIILAFEAWAVVTRLVGYGLKTEEYAFILIWVLAAAGCVLLIINRKHIASAHRTIAVISCVLAAFAVLPGIGYVDLPHSAQIARLESLLKEKGMMQNGALIPATEQLDEKSRAEISDAVDFLAYGSKGELPPWLDKSYAGNDVFKSKFGFEKLRFDNNGSPVENPGKYREVYLTAKSTAIDISEYRWSVNVIEMNKNETGAVIKGDNGTYGIYWYTAENGIPILKIENGGNILTEYSLNDYIAGLSGKYPSGSGTVEVPAEEMSISIDTAGIKALLVLSNITINEHENGEARYWINPGQLYVREK